jgi:hypothetical protein
MVITAPETTRFDRKPGAGFDHFQQLGISILFQHPANGPVIAELQQSLDDKIIIGPGIQVGKGNVPKKLF